MGYPQFPNHPYRNMYPTPEVKIPRLTKPLVQELISQHMQVPVQNINFERVAEVPASWRHACSVAGVLVMPASGFPYASGEVITYAACTHCGRVFYHFDQY